jgi:hypothetical protein
MLLAVVFSLSSRCTAAVWLVSCSMNLEGITVQHGDVRVLSISDIESYYP